MEGEETEAAEFTKNHSLFDISAFSLVIERDTRNQCETERKSPDLWKHCMCSPWADSRPNPDIITKMNCIFSHQLLQGI